MYNDLPRGSKSVYHILWYPDFTAAVQPRKIKLMLVNWIYSNIAVMALRGSKPGHHVETGGTFVSTNVTCRFYLRLQWGWQFSSPARPKLCNQVPSLSLSRWRTLTLHSDAFFRSQRDINRHGSWLDFWKIQVNLVNFISGTFGTAWDKYSKNGLTFGCLREKKGWNFDLEIIFFKQKQDFGIFI